MSVVQPTPYLSNIRRHEATPPLQPITASHPANHHMNVVTDPEEKSGLPAPTICRPSTPIPELPNENNFLDFPELSAAMSHTRGCPLQRYPNKRQPESNVTIYGQDNRISRVSKKKAYDHGARLRSRGWFSKSQCPVDTRDEMKMVDKYIDAVRKKKTWKTTRACGKLEIPRRHRFDVPFTLRESLFITIFAKSVNNVYIAMGQGPCCRVPYVYLEPEIADFDSSYLDARICEVAEVGDLRTLGNVQHFRALPEYISHEEQLEEAAAEAKAEAKAQAEAEAKARAEAGAEAAGAPETGEWDGEFDETETF